MGCQAQPLFQGTLRIKRGLPFGFTLFYRESSAADAPRIPVAGTHIHMQIRETVESPDVLLDLRDNDLNAYFTVNTTDNEYVALVPGSVTAALSVEIKPVMWVSDVIITGPGVNDGMDGGAYHIEWAPAITRP